MKRSGVWCSRWGFVIIAVAIAGGGCSLLDPLDGISDGERAFVIEADAGADASEAGSVVDPNRRRLRVFVTSTETTGGSIGTVAAADTTCNELAAAAGRTGAFVAWLSTTSSPALSRLTSTGPWYLYDDTMVVSSREQLSSGSITAPINVDEHAVGDIVDGVWTGVSASGLVGNTCQDWRIAVCLGLCVGEAGTTTAANASWSAGEPKSCLKDELRLYCFEN